MPLYKEMHRRRRMKLRREWEWLRHLHYQGGEDASAILIEPNQWAVKKWDAAIVAARLKGVPV